ncbi:hypothetical protein [Fluviicola chungangensis]|uniref:Uncharacterized protein n=1 Tax=Fluviicola chungangensis TaxID=2597671 RepID=A0A556MNJ2_9FLAO|nr:hypothetical protein [Fluviicola chungangensis]TSJ41490.1 hypothetical protein FO442_13575 [Fluviicola chungangensis]
MELYRLSCYYKHNVTPILIMEILGDLKKEATAGKPPPEDRVKDFANKLFPVEIIVNDLYLDLVHNDLMGKGPSLDGRPNVRMQKAVQSSSGQKGLVIDQTLEEKSVYKWKDGKFSEADKELSALWHAHTTQEDILVNLKSKLTLDVSGIKDFKTLNQKVTEFLTTPFGQQSFLMILLRNYKVSSIDGMEVINRWMIQGRPQISTFAPYAFHCLRVDTIFSYGLASGLITTRPTNKVDLEYLYYMPFGNIFTSNDKLHKNLAPLLLRSYQKFYTGTELKADLSNIVKYLETLPVEEVRKYKLEPPVIDGSLTAELWKEYFGYPEHKQWDRKLSDKELERSKKKIDEFEKAAKEKGLEIGELNDPDFIVKTSYLSKRDLCFCGSGKIIINCCMTEEQFDGEVRKRNH